MKKSGFTLVEILAVIVILAVILAVAIPSISGVVTNAKKNTFDENTQLILKAIDYKKTSNLAFDPTTITKDNIQEKLDISGENYESISVTMTGNRPQIVAIGDNNWNGLAAYGERGNITVVTEEELNEIYPVITILGSNPIDVNLGSSYTDAGATASDTTDGNLTSSIITTGVIDTNVAGTYYITYKVTNSSSKTTTATRTVNVKDNVSPVITMLGSTPVTVELGTTYTDAGATASDNIDGDITADIQVVSTINLNVEGTYTVTYTVSDSNGNVAIPVVRTVTVTDVTAPTIDYQFSGSAFTYVKTRNIVVTVTDAGGVDESSLKYLWQLSSEGTPPPESFVTSFVNGGTITSPAGITGSYNLCIYAKDIYHVTLTMCRMFRFDNTIPVITMNGSSPVSINQGSSYTDAGATATDNIDGNRTANISVVSNVNPNVIGSYTVTYNVSDTSGNVAIPVIRNVNVVAVDSTAPTVSFGTNGNVTYAKTRNTTVTVSDSGSGVNTSSLKYQWTTSTTAPTEASFGVLNNIINNPIALSKGNVNISYRKEYLSGNTNDTNFIAFGSDPISGTFTNGGNVNSPTGVTGGYYLWILAKDNNNNIAITRSNVFNLDNTVPVLTMLGSTPVSITQGSTYTDAGATANDNIGGNITASISTVSTVNPNAVGTYTVTYNVSDSSGNAATAVVRTVNVTATSEYVDSEEVNKPRLATGMTAVKWNGSSWDTVASPDTDTSWYDYANKEWANAMTTDGSMWVWIPRYIYKISTGWHTNTAGTINVQFTKHTNDNWNSGVIGNINADTTANASNNTWTNHPGFTFGSTELTGIWVAKFEASVSNTSDLCYTGPDATRCNKTTLLPKIVPNVSPWRYIQTGNIYTVCRNMETNATYGWGTSGTGIDTHMMKNTEWGAAAYLSKSIYGQNTNEVWINPASPYATGSAGTSVSSVYNWDYYQYNTAYGVNASTTGTVYGIYDMSGGAWEYTAAYVSNGNAALNNGSTITGAIAQYKDVYTVGAPDSAANNYALAINKKGDAFYETNSNTGGANSWFADYAYMPTGSSPWPVRGGYYSATTYAGLYASSYTNGTADGTMGFRPVLLVNTGL